MRLYLELIKNSFQASMTYRMDTLLRLFRSNMGLFIQVSIWSALLVHGVVSSNQGNITLKDMVAYIIIGTLISTLTSNEIIFRIEQKIRSGEIAMDLIKPLTLKAGLFCEQMGAAAFKLIFEVVPIIIIGALFFGFKGTALPHLMFFSVALINGLIISYLISYIMGLYVMWYMVGWHMAALLYTLQAFFSGAFIPLWFFPKVLSDISMILPFRLIYFTPISIFLGKEGIEAAILSLIQQFLWILILVIIEKIMWNRAVKKIVVQGG